MHTPIPTPTHTHHISLSLSLRQTNTPPPQHTHTGIESSQILCQHTCQLVLWAVYHKGLHQGWTQTSLYLQVIHFTSHVWWAYLYSAGTQLGNLHPAVSSTLFCRPTQEPGVSHSRQRKKIGRGFGEWTGRVEISQEEISGSRRSMYGYILTHSRL